MTEVNYDELVLILSELGPVGEAILVALRFGQIGGEHHKAWVIDQMMRHLCAKSYGDVVASYEQEGKYKWDVGIAP